MTWWSDESGKAVGEARTDKAGTGALAATASHDSLRSSAANSSNDRRK
jgi:hypothetical protein